MLKKALLIPIAVIAFVGAAFAARLHDAPYIFYVEGRRADAMDGLRAKAERGDRTAAYLVGTNYERGVLGASDTNQASVWYVNAARLGEVRSISRYINLNLSPPANIEQCAAALAVLNTAGRAGDLGSLSLLTQYYKTGFCTPIDLVTAARYYMAMTRIDRQYGDYAEKILAQIDPATARKLQPLPEKFDVDENRALAQFLAALPFGVATATP